ncbi:hypothetical protein DHD32_08935 [Arenibacter sp. TNZ]|uniref:hypothetical protein n=1 Tax=Arenibacter TaxID=178469 RepID=UPI000CD3BB84|nr:MULTISPECIES: hypothetical protein [Arenibacter]MCM4171603.1 hypothetical protein [Arenibacter sp. TNZ]
MTTTKLEKTIYSLFEALEKEIPRFQNSPEDWEICNGNVAICIISEDGKVYGKLFGTDKIEQREIFRIAWQKASQVWITGHNTGDYEKIVFGGTMDPEDAPIELPDLIGWVGGQLIQLDDESRISVGFSGFQGFNDIGIVQTALKKVLAE